MQGLMGAIAVRWERGHVPALTDGGNLNSPCGNLPDLYYEYRSATKRVSSNPVPLIRDLGKASNRGRGRQLPKPSHSQTLTAALIMELTSEKGVQCSECGKFCLNQKSLKSHMTEHKPKIYHNCNICDKAFTTKYIRNRHMLSHTHAQYKCFQCRKVFLREDGLIHHLKRHAEAPPEESNVQCLECGNFYLNQMRLKIHMAKHKPRTTYKCDVCEKVFAIKWYRDRHVRSHGDLPYKCSHCDNAFLMEKDFKRHVQKHTGERTYVCQECGKGFLGKYSLNIHMTTHTGEEPYSCSRCGKAFGKRFKCTKHIRRECGPATKDGERLPLVIRAPPPRPAQKTVQLAPSTVFYTIIASDQIVNLGNSIILPCETGGGLSSTVGVEHPVATPGDSQYLAENGIDLDTFLKREIAGFQQ
ncbi:zinc finger and SCAN domain-containing protein 12-like [Penaeus chinensis]|uniref:zinc finger and SCAN domain-containing protein 12-like n=1 Tax=Penaeus chinensis TaxID=139456 RepID=UPI001FB6711B|nr:zinc finger and SCAN domain-containing protein 12-like [Penaeus chinensis]